MLDVQDTGVCMSGYYGNDNVIEPAHPYKDGAAVVSELLSDYQRKF